MKDFQSFFLSFERGRVFDNVYASPRDPPPPALPAPQQFTGSARLLRPRHQQLQRHRRDIP